MEKPRKGTVGMYNKKVADAFIKATKFCKWSANQKIFPIMKRNWEADAENGPFPVKESGKLRRLKQWILEHDDYNMNDLLNNAKNKCLCK